MLGHKAFGNIETSGIVSLQKKDVQIQELVMHPIASSRIRWGEIIEDIKNLLQGVRRLLIQTRCGV
jgi:hypothetical protein